MRGRKTTPPHRRVAHLLCAGAKARAARKGVPFDLTPDDIHVPDVCPVLGVQLVSHAQGALGPRSGHTRVGGKKGPRPDSPSLDRVVPSKGYVRGNVVVISSRANTIKQDATAEELLRVAAWLAQHPSKESS